MTRQPAGSSGQGPHCAAPVEHCITCSDEGTPMRVVAVDEDALAWCADDGGGHGAVETALVGTVRVGDRLLVHAGTALALLEDVG